MSVNNTDILALDKFYSQVSVQIAVKLSQLFLKEATSGVSQKLRDLRLTTLNQILVKVFN